MPEITPALIRKWQNEMTAYRDSKGKPYSPVYLRNINNQLSTIMNYAVNYYGLKENPCRKAGSTGKGRAEEIQFWTVPEFKLFLENVSDKPQSRVGFLVLFYTGIRISELLALKHDDINYTNGKITINQSCQRLRKTDIITPPKTPKSNRLISVPLFYCSTVPARRSAGIYFHGLWTAAGSQNIPIYKRFLRKRNNQRAFLPLPLMIAWDMIT